MGGLKLDAAEALFLAKELRWNWALGGADGEADGLFVGADVVTRAAG